jgi:nitrous oxide reductase accessory protein NosL
MMKRSFFCLLLIVLFVLTVTYAYAQEDIQKHKSCPFCGMDREKFAHSRVLIEYDDGTTFGACSIHCAAVELAINIDKTPRMIQVGDYNTKKLIDAEKASWVIGGSKMGVMTKRAKWAFEKKDDAEAFIKENGGALAAFDEVMKAAYEDMYTDTKMIREKRKMMKMKQMGH